MESVASLVPYLKANPAFKFMIDSFVHQGGCWNHVEIKAWGCSHPGHGHDENVAMEGATLSSSNGTIIPGPIKVFPSLTSLPSGPPGSFLRCGTTQNMRSDLQSWRVARCPSEQRIRVRRLRLPRRSEVAAEGGSGRDEEAEAVRRRALENENRVAIAMAEAEKRIADAAEKKVMEHARGRDAAGSRLRDAGHAGEAAAVRGLPPQAGKKNKMPTGSP
jgi:hypothetical protein